MPMGDGTGPMGNRQFGRGLGPCGRVFRRGFLSQPLQLDREQQRKVLEAQKAELEAELKLIENEINGLKK